MVGALGTAWILDGLEVTLVGALSSALKDHRALGLDESQIGLTASAYLVGAILGAVGFGRLADAERDGNKIYAVLKGVGVASDGRAKGLLAPRLEGELLALQRAYEAAGVDPSTIGLIEAHGTATLVGDATEITALREVFGSRIPPVNSTKSLTGHSLGAAGVQESIYSLLQMQGGFIAESANIEEIDPELADAPVVRARIDGAKIERVLSNSFGFGGTNATLVLTAVH